MSGSGGSDEYAFTRSRLVMRASTSDHTRMPQLSIPQKLSEYTASKPAVAGVSWPKRTDQTMHTPVQSATRPPTIGMREENQRFTM